MDDYYDALEQDFLAATRAKARNDDATLALLANEFRQKRTRSRRVPTLPDVTREGHSRAATAAALPAPIEPKVPAEDEAPYASKLRVHRTKNPKTQSVVDAMAIFDENAREALLRGERVRESDIPKGVGPNFLQALGDKLDSLVFEQLQLRDAKKARANRFYDAGKRAAEKLTEMGKLAEQQGDLTGMWQFDTRAQELAAERDLANRKRNALREQIAAGVYEEVQGTAWKTRSAIATTQEQPEVEPRSL